MLKETEETRHFCHLFLIGYISIGGNPGPLPPPPLPCYAYGALAMIARFWLFCYDIFTLNTISCFILSRNAEAVEAVKILWKRKHFNERDFKRKQTRKRLILSGAGSGSKKFQR